MISKEDLERLPRRAILGFAVRCARRVQPFTKTWSPQLVQGVDHALFTLEISISRDKQEDSWLSQNALFAADLVYSWLARTVSSYTVDKARASTLRKGWADDAARWEIQHALSSANQAVETATRSDYDQLVRLDLGSAEAWGQPFDVTESGPLGPLWPIGMSDPFADIRKDWLQILGKPRAKGEFADDDFA